MFFHEYPYTDAHELNLDWIIRKIKELNQSMSDFEALNKITFDGTWDITKQYPAWCIVNNGTQGYISIRPVPADVLLGNNEYWRGVVDYTATIADLQNRVVNLENTVGDASSGLVKDVDDLQSDVLQIETDLEPLIRPRRFLMLGDSYNLITATKWTDIVDDLMELSNTYVLTTGGYGFVAQSGGVQHHWIDQVMTLDIGDDDTLTDILIVGGANDAGGLTANIPQAIIDFDTYVRGRFHNLKNIYLGFAGNSFYNQTNQNLMRAAYYYYNEGAKSCGWHYLNGIETTLFYPPFIQKIGVDDFIHPTEPGVKEIGANIVACLNTGACHNDHKRDQISLTLDTSNFVAGTLTINELLHDNILTFYTNDLTIQTNANVSGTVTLGTVPELTNAVVPYMFLPVNIISGTDMYRATLTFTDFNTVALMLPTGKSIASGAYFNILAIYETLDLKRWT